MPEPIPSLAPTPIVRQLESAILQEDNGRDLHHQLACLNAFLEFAPDHPKVQAAQILITSNLDEIERLKPDLKLVLDHGDFPLALKIVKAMCQCNPGNIVLQGAIEHLSLLANACNALCKSEEGESAAQVTQRKLEFSHTHAAEIAYLHKLLGIDEEETHGTENSS